MLGKDCDKNEFWFFKEEPSRLFIKKFEFEEPKEKPEVIVIDD